MSDISLKHTADGGEITITGGVVLLSGGLETAVYLSLFGGNEDDPGLSDSMLSWWGNAGLTDEAEQYRSRTQFLLKAIPLTSGNLLKIIDAVIFDLRWMSGEKIISDLEVSASIPGLNRISICVNLTAEGQPQDFTFTENWRASV